MSKRHDIVQAVKTALETIVSGYQVTVAGRLHTCSSSPKSVTIWKKTPYSLAQVPAIGIWDTDQTKEADIATMDETGWKLIVTIVGFISGTSPAEAARSLQDDVLAVLGSDQTLTGLSILIDVPTVKLLIDDSGADIIAGCELTAEVYYRSTLWSV